MEAWSALSISRSARELVDGVPFSARVLAAFERACDLVSGDGQVIAVVTAGVGNGPLNIVIDAAAGGLADVRVGAPAWRDGTTLHVDGLSIGLDGAKLWEPVPDWAALRARREQMAPGLAALEKIVRAKAPGDSLARICLPDEDGPRAEAGRLVEGLRALRAGWGGDAAALREGVARLAGMGKGLTPAGDDFLAGSMLWAWLAHPDPAPFCDELAGAAAPRTTTLAAALLRAAAHGECSAAWHAMLGCLAADDDPGGSIRRPARTSQVLPAALAVLAHGATSGADMLAGFLWAAGHLDRG